MSKVRLCFEIMPTGKQCQQFALKKSPWCREHSTAKQRERLADSRQLIGMISGMNLYSVVNVFANIVEEYRERLIPPLQAQAIVDAILNRLDELMGYSHPVQSSPSSPMGDTKSHQEKRLHAVPMK